MRANLTSDLVSFCLSFVLPNRAFRTVLFYEKQSNVLLLCLVNHVAAFRQARPMSCALAAGIEDGWVRTIRCESKKTSPFYFCDTLSKQVCFEKFWQAYTSVNFLSQAFFIFFIKSKVENQLKFQQLHVTAQLVFPTHNRQAASSRDARLHHSTKPVAS